MIPFCHGILGEVEALAKKGKRKRDFIVVTFVSMLSDALQANH